VLAALVLAELSLRLSLSYLPLPLADALCTGYVDFGDGIYRFDPTLNTERMRPHYRREMFFNGYYWHHQTDWMGFRNPKDRSHVDIALIGDSMVYGHGLEEPSTVRSNLERFWADPSAISAFKAAGWIMNTKSCATTRLSCRQVGYLFFFLNNDLGDLDRLSEADLQRFL
jgi:hypothetical protein